LERVFTPQELDYSLGKKRAPEHLAARFAAKEALIKASGLSSPWRRIEVLNALQESLTSPSYPQVSILRGFG
jgi:phosphopantetheine--protein transferase-like protein